jgi:hypothetical protein
VHSSRSKIPSKNLVHIYIYIYICVKFLALLGAPYIYDISRLRVRNYVCQMSQTVQFTKPVSITLSLAGGSRTTSGNLVCSKRKFVMTLDGSICPDIYGLNESAVFDEMNTCLCSCM